MAKWEWLPLTEEEQNSPSMEVELNPVDPELAEEKRGRLHDALRHMDMMIAYEEAIHARNIGVKAASNARKEAGDATTEEVKRALEDKLDLHPAHADKSNRALAVYLAGALPHLSESTIRKHLNKIRKK